MHEVLKKFLFPRATTTVAQILEGSAPSKVVLNGWLTRKPKTISKGLLFANLRDRSGEQIQLVDGNIDSSLKKLKPESAVAIEGELQVSAGKSEIKVSTAHVLNRANVVPGELLDTKEWPAEYRFLQLRQSDLQKNIRKRARIMQTCRNVLDRLDFTEIETPLLFKSTPEGAREFLVPTRKKQTMYALPQSPQQYKQILMASGFERYYQIAKCFRDEDLRADRQPEFTQLDMELAFANEEDVKTIVEKLVKQIWEEHAENALLTIGRKRGTQFGTLNYKQAIELYGSDKPDLRSDLVIKRLPATAQSHPKYPVLEAVVVPKQAQVDLSLARKELYPTRAPLIFEYNDEAETRKLIEPLANVPDWDAFHLSLAATKGDVIAISDRMEFSYEAMTPIGKFRQLVVESCESLRIQNSVALWVNEFPLFEPRLLKEGSYPEFDFSSIKATHHPFTMVALEDVALLDISPLECRGSHYDLVIDGVEIGGGSTRVHDEEFQKHIFGILKIGNFEKQFGHLLAAFATGCPPHAGLAIGLDRLVAMLCGTSSLRDVIAFPKTIRGADPVVGSPSEVTGAQLEPYHIKVL